MKLESRIEPYQVSNEFLSQIISTKNSQHFTWGKVCDGWWLKKGGRFTVIAETMPTGAKEIKHFHNETEQFFYVLDGILTIELNNKIYHVHKDESIVILPGVHHRVINNSNQDVQFLVVSCPDSHDDRVNLEG